ncbi:uncharacterized protein LOC6621226 [Drosophila sechellia]|uniref:GM12963 n=1 Tax=Drosophila sechellia TaxID=7238 RepID=B4INU4_DROSE|nr:uncharacterized protein LOC6621226 [Drosophila sechellia]EDW43600.1 GM12963 [Drosophila sechellia]
MRKVNVLVRTRDDKKTVYEVDRFGTVANLKARIGRAMSVPMGFSQLSYNGRVLSNQSVLLDVGHKSTLDLTWKPVVLTPKQLREKGVIGWTMAVTLIGGYQQCKERGGSIVNLPDGARQRIFNAGNDDELEAQDLTGLDLISIKGGAGADCSNGSHGFSRSQ